VASITAWPIAIVKNVVSLTKHPMKLCYLWLYSHIQPSKII
jgi:hypothetical protein